MTLTRRLSALEASSDATERVVRWLADAHSFGSLDAYADHSLEVGPEFLPLNRLPREAVAAIRARRGPRTRDLDEEIRVTLRALVFRVHLVFRIIERTSEVMEREELVLALMTAQVCLTLEVRPEEKHRMGGLPKLRDLSMFRVTELLALQEARERAAEQYLTGTECLFPDAARRWDETVHASQMAAVMADRLVELDGGASIDPERSVPTEERIEECLADLVEPARIKTLDEMGDGRAAADRTRRWLAAKAGRSGDTAS